MNKLPGLVELSQKVKCDGFITVVLMFYDKKIVTNTPLSIVERGAIPSSFACFRFCFQLQ